MDHWTSPTNVNMGHSPIYSLQLHLARTASGKIMVHQEFKIDPKKKNQDSRKMTWIYTILPNKISTKLREMSVWLAVIIHPSTLTMGPKLICSVGCYTVTYPSTSLSGCVDFIIERIFSFDTIIVSLFFISFSSWFFLFFPT